MSVEWLDVEGKKRWKAKKRKYTRPGLFAHSLRVPISSPNIHFRFISTQPNASTSPSQLHQRLQLLIWDFY